MDKDSHLYLVTGGAGFIGSHIVDDLIKRSHNVRVVDNLSSGDSNKLDNWMENPGFEFVRGDLKNPNVACRSIDGVKTIFHLAANPEVRVAEVNPSVHFRENLLTTFNILEAIRKSEADKLIVFFSSSTVYGEPNKIPTFEDYAPLLPISIYGASKLGCEALISAYCHTFGVRGLIFRLANIVGDGSTHGVIVDFIRKLKNNPRELEILGDGTQSKSYLHVDDVVNAVFLVLKDFLCCGETTEIYNVGSSDRIDVRRIAELVCDEMRLSNVRFRFTGGVDCGRGWKGDVKTMLLSIDKLLNLGWKPTFNSEEAVRLTCRQLGTPFERSSVRT